MLAGLLRVTGLGCGIGTRGPLPLLSVFNSRMSPRIPDVKSSELSWLFVDWPFCRVMSPLGPVSDSLEEAEALSKELLLLVKKV